MHNTNNSNLKPMSLSLNNTYVIEANGGVLSYKTNNIPLQSLMETLEEKLKTKPAWEIEAAIKAI